MNIEISYEIAEFSRYALIDYLEGFEEYAAPALKELLIRLRAMRILGSDEIIFQNGVDKD